MKNLWLLSILVIALTGCGSADKPINATPGTPAIERLRELTDNARLWAPSCSLVDGLTYPSLQPNGDAHDCGDGDGVYMNGTLCAVGETASCDMVRESVGADGRLWRSPYRRLNGDTGVDTASRDQLNGLLLYLVTTKDTDTARRFQGYIETNGTLCPFSTDSRCNLTAVSYGLLAKVWSHIGLSAPLSWQAQATVLTKTLELAAKTTPPGYQMFLVGQQILILIRTGDYSLTASGASLALHERDTANPFYRYLAKGADLQAIQLAIDQVPTAKPANPFQWAIARDTAEQAYKDSAGWDYIFLYKLFVGGVK